MLNEVVFRIRPEISNDEMDRLHAGGFPGHVAGHDWAPQLDRSLLWIGAYYRDRLVGFVNLAWDGGVHAFLLDTAVALDLRGRGIGTQLVREAIAAARRDRRIEWVHVDSDEELMQRLYLRAGFDPSAAGIVRVAAPPPPSRYKHTDVRRDGDVVVRSAKVSTPTVHALLRHLEAVGFDGAPRVVGSGFDTDGNETLTYIEGDVCPEGQPTIEAAAAVGDLLRRLHDATKTFQPPTDAYWKEIHLREFAGDMPVIGHCDLGPWNVVLRDGLPRAFIDWDFAGPVDALAELAEAAHGNCGLYSDESMIEGRRPPPDLDFRCRQLRAFVDAYGLARRRRDRLVDLMIENTVRSMASDTREARVTSETRESDALWGLTWQARTGEWLLRNRPTLQRALHR